MSVGFRILQPPVLFCVLFYPLLLFGNSKRGICLLLGYVSDLHFKTSSHVRSIQAPPRAQIILSDSHPMSNPYKLPRGLLCHIRKGPCGHFLNPERQKVGLLLWSFNLGTTRGTRTNVVDVVLSQNKGTQYRPRNTIILIIVTPKKVPLILGNPT